MFCHKFGIVKAKAAIDNSEPFGFSTLPQSYLSLSPKQSKYQTQQISRQKSNDLEYRQSFKLEKIKMDRSNKCQQEEGILPNPSSIEYHENNDKKSFTQGQLSQVIRSVNVSPSRKDYLQMLNHSLILFAQKKRVMEVGSLTERKKNINDATVYPPIIKRSSPSKIIIDFYNLKQLKQINNLEKQISQKVESPQTSRKQKRKHRKKKEKKGIDIKQFDPQEQNNYNKFVVDNYQQISTKHVKEELSEDNEKSLVTDINKDYFDLNLNQQSDFQNNSNFSRPEKEKFTTDPSITKRLAFQFPKKKQSSNLKSHVSTLKYQNEQQQNPLDSSQPLMVSEKNENQELLKNNILSPQSFKEIKNSSGIYGRSSNVQVSDNSKDTLMEPSFPKLKYLGSDQNKELSEQIPFDLIPSDHHNHLQNEGSHSLISQRDLFLQNCIQMKNNLSDLSKKSRTHLSLKQEFKSSLVNQNQNIEELYDPSYNFKITSPLKKKSSDRELSPTNTHIYTPILAMNSDSQTSGSSRKGTPKKDPILNQSMRQFKIKNFQKNFIDYSFDIPCVGVQGYQELRIRLTNIVLKYAIFEESSLNDLFEQTAQQNRHLDPQSIQTIFDQVRFEFK